MLPLFPNCTFSTHTCQCQRPAKRLLGNNAHKTQGKGSKAVNPRRRDRDFPLSAASRPSGIPLGNLHSAVLVKVLVHVERVPQKVGLVPPALAQALELGAVEVVGQDWLVVGVGALLNDFAGALTRRHAGNVSEADFGDDHVDCEVCQHEKSSRGIRVVTYDRAQSGRHGCT
jgi:hypothetical protein